MYENSLRSWAAQNGTRKPAIIHKTSLLCLFYSFFHCPSPTSYLLHINLNYILKFSYESSNRHVVRGFPPKFYMHYLSPHLSHIKIQKKSRFILLLNRICVEFQHLLCRINFISAKYILRTLTILQPVSPHCT